MIATGKDEPHDVAVVGFGPVGAVLAILLAQRGHDVVVLERQSAPYPLPRAVHLDHETARIVQACGLGEELAATTEPAAVYEWRSAAGTTLLRFGREGVGASGWPFSSMFHQPTLEAALRERAAELGVDVRAGDEVTTLDQHPDGVTLHHRDRDGIERTTNARWVVGCDGARSTVRTLLDVAVTDLGYFYDWLIVDVILDEPRVFDPVNLQVCDPARPTTVVSGGPGRRRWEFMRLPDEPIEDLDQEATAWGLLAPWDVHPGNATLERRSLYTFGARWVHEWRRDRVLLAGDAAHQMPPFAGQGMCSGLRDANNLAWKLGQVLDGTAGEAILHTYGAERVPHVQQAIELSMSLGQVICVPDAGEATVRDAAMAADARSGRLTEVPDPAAVTGGITAAGAPGAGSLGVQGVVLDGDPRVRLDDVAGTGWRLVTGSGAVGALPAELAAWFAAIGGAVVEVGAGSRFGDPDGTYAEWFERLGAVAVLVRPDFAVYGGAVGPDDAIALLELLRRDLHADWRPGLFFQL